MSIEDYGDKFDKFKWDFDEKKLYVTYIDNYPYKTIKKNDKIVLTKLVNLRKDIHFLCKNLEFNRKEWSKTTHNKEYINGVNIFLEIHNEYYYNPNELPNPFNNIAKTNKTSRYLLSEIPEGTKFSGINKPKMRYIDENVPYVGEDENGRALYRDIFIDFSYNNTPNKLKKLIIHELAHTMSNHIRWRDDDHYGQFEWSENLIKNYWPN